MKNILKCFALVCVAVGMASCVQDLNTTPIDPNSSTSFNADRMFTKCYSCMAVIGQSGPGENSDVEDMDAGMSGFYRTIWYCNDLTADDAFWIWDDDESRGFPTTNWTGSSGMTKGIYTRLNLNIKYCNHYLTYAPKETDEDKYRLAEVRWIRAFHYFYLMDMFLYAPFVTTESSEYPHYVSRHELYKWLVDELKELEIELPAQRVQPYRVGKAAAQLLLARIYLNADVYNKYNKAWTAGNMWQKAYDAATTVITDNPQHDLVTTAITTDSGFVYTAYQQLFMGDNDRPEIMKEAIFQIYQDGFYTQSHAGGNFLVAGPRHESMNAWGIEAQWHALRTSPTLVDKFLKPLNMDRKTAEEMIYDEYEMPKQLGDDRAILCSYGLKTPKKKNFNLSGDAKIGDESYFYNSWAGLKFTGVYATKAQLPKLSPRRNKDWADTDIPMLRLAEAYMIQAEALFRMGNKTGALSIINDKIRARANAAPLLALDEVSLLEEWSREFWFEGRRRMDLIRFNRFFGPQADMYRYQWEGRMGKADGQQFFISGPEHMNWFPIPDEDKRSNPNFKTDIEQNADNQFASQGGDGYVY